MFLSVVVIVIVAKTVEMRDLEWHLKESRLPTSPPSAHHLQLLEVMYVMACHLRHDPRNRQAAVFRVEELA